LLWPILVQALAAHAADSMQLRPVLAGIGVGADLLLLRYYRPSPAWDGLGRPRLLEGGYSARSGAPVVGTHRGLQLLSRSMDERGIRRHVGVVVPELCRKEQQ